MRTIARTASLTDLTAELDRAVRGHGSDADTAEAVARALTPYLGADGLLTPEQREGDPERYRQHLLHVADDGAFSVVALVWLPGQATPVHDHVCWCVVGVHEGDEEELRYRVDDGRLVTTERLVNPRGDQRRAAARRHPPGAQRRRRPRGLAPRVRRRPQRDRDEHPAALRHAGGLALLARPASELRPVGRS